LHLWLEPRNDKDVENKTYIDNLGVSYIGESNGTDVTVVSVITKITSVVENKVSVNISVNMETYSGEFPNGKYVKHPFTGECKNVEIVE